MAISESQLQSWSRQGAIATAKLTHESIRRAFEIVNWPPGMSYDLYLQGSYRNDTNIRGESDVDVVVELTSTFYSNLNEEQKRTLGLMPATYGWSDFMRDALNILKTYYGEGQIIQSNKCINLAPSGGRLPADIVVCSNYRWYSSLSSFVEGVTFWTHGNNQQIASYPKIHTEKCITKNGSTNGWFKPTVRMFKNARSHLIDNGVIDDKVAPSHFLECLIYRVPDDRFGNSFQDTYCNILNWLLQANLNQLMFPSVSGQLCGSNNGQWSIDKANRLLNELVKLWNNS